MQSLIGTDIADYLFVGCAVKTESVWVVIIEYMYFTVYLAFRCPY